MSISVKDLSYYLSLPYPFELVESSAGGFVAHHPDLPGCAAQSEDIHGALGNLGEARRLWLTAKLQTGEPIPEPAPAQLSGRIIVRMPIRLHAGLGSLAAEYDKSLNRLLNEILFNYANALPLDHGLGEPTGAERAAAGEELDPAALLVRFTPDEEGGVLAEHPDLPGCVSAGDTVSEALEGLATARQLWLEERREAALPIPEPLSALHSGMINLRLAPGLHASLARDAERNGTTLNQLINFALAGAVGRLIPERQVFVPDPLSVDDHVRKALPYLRVNPDRTDLGSLVDLPASHDRFLRALVCLEQYSTPGRLASASDYIAQAYVEGLDFTNEAVRIFRSVHSASEVRHQQGVAILMRRGPTPEAKELQDQVLELMQALPASHPGRRLVNSLMMVFLNGVKEIPARQREWRLEIREDAASRFGLARRSRAEDGPSSVRS